MLEMIEALDRISRLPDDAPVTPQMAAVYLGRSPKTLENWRGKGMGPPYIQPFAEGSKARNQMVMYQMGDLRVFMNSHRVKSTMDAAVARGMAYDTLGDMCGMLMPAEPDVQIGLDFLSGTVSDEQLRTSIVPFWTNSDGKLIAVIGQCSAQENADLLAAGAVVDWIPASELWEKDWAPNRKHLGRVVVLLVHLFHPR
jgi:hypothetical protein